MKDKIIDEQIIKALECCAKEEDGNCAIRGCPLHKHCKKDIHTLEKSALDLINRQKAEIDRLKKENEFHRKTITENAQRALEVLVDEIDKAKSEAIKEFAERLKEKTKLLPFAAMPHTYVTGIDIDRLVKEMEGGTDE